uniref:Uncharacterized protein n=1 Tax=Palpitomonas bilix TaxID=652834 RepID=A0A7S3GKM4_9EUKA|mmetsp:Transcript_7661/g.19875  ORF Transcript_7661/g.19875 Transcript_7661/m.19875 type:complete len:166 (+) Transcript_7661:243-740(+)
MTSDRPGSASYMPIRSRQSMRRPGTASSTMGATHNSLPRSRPVSRDASRVSSRVGSPMKKPRAARSNNGDDDLSIEGMGVGTSMGAAEASKGQAEITSLAESSASGMETVVGNEGGMKTGGGGVVEEDKNAVPTFRDPMLTGGQFENDPQAMVSAVHCAPSPSPF